MLGFQYRRALRAVGRMRSRGYPVLSAMLVHFPRIVAVRIYRVATQPINRGGIFRSLNRRRLRLLHSADPRHAEGGHFYVIVMPHTLHFLIACLALLPPHLRVMLVANGVKPWERRLIARRLGHLPMCRLARMPGTSLTHGDVITLLLQSNRGNFGLLDHDCFVLDSDIFESLAPGPTKCLTAIYGGHSASTGLYYPETFFVYLNAPVLRALMERYRVDARSYRVAPARVRSAIADIGFRKGAYFKDYHDFFDTLNLLVALAIADGYGIDFLQRFDSDAIVHIGGTSYTTDETKELIDCYAEWCFLELCGEPELRSRYARRFRPFQSSDQVRSAMGVMSPEAFARVTHLDRVVTRCRQAAGAHSVPSARRTATAKSTTLAHR